MGCADSTMNERPLISDYKLGKREREGREKSTGHVQGRVIVADYKSALSVQVSQLRTGR